MNVLFITIDCLRHDKVGAVNSESKFTPNIDRSSQGATVFTQAIAQGNATAKSFASLLTSTYPYFQKTSTAWGALPQLKDKPTLARLLKQHGFATGGFNSNPWLSTLCGYGSSYDIYEDNLQPISDRSNSTLAVRAARALYSVDPFAQAEKVTAQALNWIKQQRGPYYAWIHYMDVHGPYPIGQRWPIIGHRLSWPLYQRSIKNPQTISPAESKRLKEGYEKAIGVVDQSWQFLENELTASGHLDDTLLIFAADHGEAFGEHGNYTHGGVAGFYDEVIRVPLIIRWPGKATVPRVEGQTALTTIVPTVLDILGLSIPEHVIGHSAVPWLTGDEDPTRPVDEVAYTHGAIHENYAAMSLREEEWKYMIHYNPEKNFDTRRLYHLATDPSELVECGDGYPEVRDRLHARVEANIETYLRQSDEADDTDDTEEVSDDIMTRLRDLGYID